MNEKRAIQILKALVQGTDPASGEEFVGNRVLQQVDVLRALLAGVVALEAQAARASRRALLPANVGNPWTPEEERALVTAFQAGDALNGIAEKFGRTLRSIESRLERLGLLTKELRETGNTFT